MRGRSLGAAREGAVALIGSNSGGVVDRRDRGGGVHAGHARERRPQIVVVVEQPRGGELEPLKRPQGGFGVGGISVAHRHQRPAGA